MGIKTIQDMLPLVEQPSRYLGTEINSIHKDPRKVKLNFLFAFPDRYEIGTSHFGIQILYHSLNSDKEMLAERVFAPAIDMAAQMRAYNIPLSALESGRPAREFDIIGFSLLYELNYTNILYMLDLAGIPFRANQRGKSDPLIIGGGPCTSNPEPLADFFDAMLIGDGETALPEMAKSWIQWRESGETNRESLFLRWSKITGVYIPAYYTPTFDSDGFQHMLPTRADIPPVRRAIIGDLDSAAFPEAPILPFGRPVHDRLRLEVSRGCTRGCRFCQAGMIYRPVRERAMGTLLRLSENALANTGYEDLSLLSLSTSDYGCIGPLLANLMARGEADRVAVSLPSFRAGTLNTEMMALVKKVRKTGFTIAAEAGSQRLRNVINKNIQQEDIIQTVQDAFKLGWQVIKLYFMIGLPTERASDLEAMVALINELRKIPGAAGRKGKINISVNTFIPKSHTPFQWAAQLSIDESEQRFSWLQDRMKRHRIQFKWQAPEASFLEGLWARGDRRLSELLEAAYQQGCLFDGWSDQFRYDRWQRALEQTGLNADFYITRNRNPLEPLPWDHIDMRINKAYLIGELEKSLTGAETPDCRYGNCQGCGVCDFEQIEPKVFSGCPSDSEPARPATEKKEIPIIYQKLYLRYKKIGEARFLGHLELVNMLLRAIRRAGIPLKYTEGFHPMPKVSFDDPPPLGMASEDESFTIIVPSHISTGVVMEKINAHLANGLSVFDVQLIPMKTKPSGIRKTTYTIMLTDGLFDPARLARFEEQPSVVVSRTNAKGKVKTIDLKQAIGQIHIQAPERLTLTLQKDGGGSARPADVLASVFELSDETIKRALVTKTGTADI
ncbi:MAG: TIGR03960 family B12-binding radical SAM protein [Desulfobacterales bacterium]|jgi:radical SAM family uncharacterized protein/radical SAM-linked protein|nr:TIGR03960 family B12-binding radical SAM protein [Desulfobacterales bacterium]